MKYIKAVLYWLREHSPWPHKNNLTKERPPGWDKSLLAAFFEEMWSNSIGTYAKLGEARRVQDIDALMNHFVTNTSHVKNKAALTVGLPLLLFIRAHSSFRAAASLAMSGAIPEAMAGLRLALETAGYASLVENSEKLSLVWLNRGDSDEAKAECRREFRNADVRDALTARDAVLSGIYQSLYEYLIDGGAHPNEHGFMRNMQVTNMDDGGARILQIYLQDDPDELDRGVRAVGKIGVCILMIMETMHPDVFKILGISERLPRVRQGL